MATWIGYHGTNSKNISSIQEKGYIPSSANHWFGQGVYFFGDMPPRINGKIEARNWVLYVKNQPNWAVFKAEIASEKIFDLVDNVEHKQAFERLRVELLQKHTGSGKDPIYFKDQAIFKVIEAKSDFEVVRALVDAAKKGYSAYVMLHPQIQICVKHLPAIKKNELLEKGTGNVELRRNSG